MKKITIFTLMTLSMSSLSATDCSEKISSVILHENGEVYFKTSSTCTDTWCHINWSTTDAKNRACSSMLTARTTDRPMTFTGLTLTAAQTKMQRMHPQHMPITEIKKLKP